MSYPSTGSTGDGYRFARENGHHITELVPALVPLQTAGDICSRLQGLSLRNIKAVLTADGKKVYDEFGEMLFTHFGVSGPVILSASSHLKQYRGKKLELHIDWKPALSDEQLDHRILRDFQKVMNTYRIITDSSCDMTQEMADALELDVVPLTVNYKGKEYPNYLDGRELNIGTFYESLRAGEMATTSAVNPTAWKAAAEKAMQAGQDVLILAFSSGLSTTFSAAVMASQELLEEYPDRKIYVVDTLCASLGQGLLCYHVANRRLAGATLEEARDYAEANKLHLCHWFTVDDLMFLKRGGRVSGATAVMGSLLQIKPVMHVDNDGHLVPVSKARGRKASIQAMAAKVGETAIEPEKQTMFISHGDCRQDAEYLAGLLREKYHVPKIEINYVGPVIGSHSGPGTLALFFLGTHR